ncbi:nicotinate-nucleotide--dimethylbenzimidazole phosphoribosyltransferase [Candidatus Poribacteria bacterium]|nr:nicotinate-nucleotide--dimethylbenzimidazole phosphoribosyltransferase [Candidatus Poribacteria bacterium]
MDKLQEIISKIKPMDKSNEKQVQARLDDLTKPQGSLGRLEELAKKYVLITGKAKPVITSKVIFTLAGDHGVAKEGVSAFPQEVTEQMVYNFVRGGAGINVLARHINARVIVADFGVAQDLKDKTGIKIKKIDYGTKNFTVMPAMTKEQAELALLKGIELVEEELKSGIDIVGVGEMGIANTTSASAIAAAFSQKPVEDVVGRGTGINQDALNNKIAVIKKSLLLHKPDSHNAIDILSKVGGFEIGGIAGIILACSAYNIPVVIDGFISTAGALIAAGIKPEIKDYLIASHKSVEPGHKIMLEYLGLTPLLQLDLRLGEGTGAALGINLVEAGVKILTEMATFSSAGVSQSN